MKAFKLFIDFTLMCAFLELMNCKDTESNDIFEIPNHPATNVHESYLSDIPPSRSKPIISSRSADSGETTSATFSDKSFPVGTHSGWNLNTPWATHSRRRRSEDTTLSPLVSDYFNTAWSQEIISSLDSDNSPPSSTAAPSSRTQTLDPTVALQGSVQDSDNTTSCEHFYLQQGAGVIFGMKFRRYRGKVTRLARLLETRRSIRRHWKCARACALHGFCDMFSVAREKKICWLYNLKHSVNTAPLSLVDCAVDRCFVVSCNVEQDFNLFLSTTDE